MIKTISYCQPYETENGLQFTICGGKITSIQDGEKVIYNATLEDIEKYARQENPDFELYKGYTPSEILINASEMKSCCDCPFFEECEVLEKPEKGMIYSDPDGDFEILEVKPEGVTVKNTETGKEYIIPYKEALYFVNFKF